MCELMANSRKDERHFAFINKTPFVTVRGSQYQAVMNPGRTLMRYEAGRAEHIAVWNTHNQRVRNFYKPTRSSITRLKTLSGKIKNICRRENQAHHTKKGELPPALQAGKPAASNPSR